MNSKILTYLNVPESVSSQFSTDAKELVELIDGTQQIYSELQDKKKKEALSQGIVSMMRILLEYLKSQQLGIYTQTTLKLEEKTLPKVEPKPVSTPPTPPSPPTPPTPPSPPQPPKRERKPKQTPPTPPTPQEHKPQYTKEELEEAIQTQEVIYEISQELEDLEELNRLEELYNRYYSK